MRKLFISDFFSNGIRNELRRALIQISHCQYSKTGHIFKSAVRRCENKDSSIFYIRDTKLSTNYANKFILVCEILQDHESIKNYSSELLKLSGDKYIHFTEENRGIKKIQSSLIIENLLNKDFFYLLLERFKTMSNYVLSVVSVANVNREEFLDVNKNVIHLCVKLCEFMLKSWEDYIEKKNFMFLANGSVKMAEVIHSIEVLFYWLNYLNLGSLYLQEKQNTWEERVYYAKLNVLKNCKCEKEGCYTSSLLFGKEDSEKTSIIPTVFNLAKLKICYVKDPLFKKSIELVEKRFRNKKNGLLKCLETEKKFNEPLANFLYVDVMSEIDIDKAYAIFEEIKNLNGSNFHIPNIFSISGFVISVCTLSKFRKI